MKRKCCPCIIVIVLSICCSTIRYSPADTNTNQTEAKEIVKQVVQEQPELAGNIRKLEEDYDNEIFDNEMGDLKKWLGQQGIKLD